MYGVHCAGVVKVVAPSNHFLPCHNSCHLVASRHSHPQLCLLHPWRRSPGCSVHPSRQPRCQRKRLPTCTPSISWAVAVLGPMRHGLRLFARCFSIGLHTKIQYPSVEYVVSYFVCFCVVASAHPPACSLPTYLSGRSLVLFYA